MLMLGSVFTHPQRGDTIIALTTDTTDLLTAATVGVELQGECNLCSIIRAVIKLQLAAMENQYSLYKYLEDYQRDCRKSPILVFFSISLLIKSNT